MLVASAHHVVVQANIIKEKMCNGRRPMVSERRPKRGWKAVLVSKKAVESHEALLEALK